MPSSTRKTLIKHNRQARRRDRENADFLGVIFFISFLLKIGHLQDDRIGLRQRLPSFLTLSFCNVSIPAKIRFEGSCQPRSLSAINASSALRSARTETLLS